MKNNKGFISTVALYTTLLIVLLLIFYIMYFLSMGKVASDYILSKSKEEVDKIQPSNVSDTNRVLINFASNLSGFENKIEKQFSPTDDIQYYINTSNIDDSQTEQTVYNDLSRLDDASFDTFYYVGSSNGNLIVNAKDSDDKCTYPELIVYNPNGDKEWSTYISYSSNIKEDSYYYYFKKIDWDQSEFNNTNCGAANAVYSYSATPKTLFDSGNYGNLYSATQSEYNSASTANFKNRLENNLITDGNINFNKMYENACDSDEGTVEIYFETNYGETSGWNVKKIKDQYSCSSVSTTILSGNDLFTYDNKYTIFIKGTYKIDGDKFSHYSLLSFKNNIKHTITLLSNTKFDVPNYDNSNKYYISFIDINSDDEYEIQTSEIDNDFNKIIYINSDDSVLKKKIANTIGIDESKVRYAKNLEDAINDAKNSINSDINKIQNIKEAEKNNQNYIDDSGANSPMLSIGMIPVVYDENSAVWKVADLQSKWYDYDNQMWANAVTVNDDNSNLRTAEAGTEIPMSAINTMWVWIPRFRYNIEGEFGTHINGIEGTKTLPGQIKIEFSKIIENAHPAFTFNKKELSGFWFGKFETGGSLDSIIIKPNINTLTTRYDILQIYNMFDSTRNMEKSNNKFGFTSETGTLQEDGNYSSSNNGINTHMAKGTEWGAVAYLSQSVYGKYGNPSYNNEDKEIYNNNSFSSIKYKCVTGKSGGEPKSEGKSGGTYEYNKDLKGTGASTTGTIYGVYDMNGGANEFVMSTMYSKNYPDELVGSSASHYNGPAPFGIHNRYNSGKNYPSNVYYDAYDYNHKTCIVGDATCETQEWYSSTNNFYNNSSWIVREGVFGYTSDIGVAYRSQSFRISLVNTD